jgi:hypothetical protein
MPFALDVLDPLPPATVAPAPPPPGFDPFSAIFPADVAQAPNTQERHTAIQVVLSIARRLAARAGPSPTLR